MLTYRFRPVPVWPHPATPQTKRRGPSTFRAAWSDTLSLLEHELGLLRADNVVLGAGFADRDLRMDGMPRTSAHAPSHPGIELSFTSPHGRLVYATDTCVNWRHNVRSIALGLQALRAVDRFGITRRGEQYAGWAQLTTANPDRVDRGRDLVVRHGDVRTALKATHPDHGGDPDDFVAVQAYRALDA